jgi:hypothetical protein
LLGAAYLVLLVGYVFGLKALKAHQSPLPANGLAFVILLFCGLSGGWES